MKKSILAGLVVSAVLSGAALADERQVIVVPPEVKTAFLTEMRTHLDNLNEITLSLASGDFTNAAYVAENKMGFGHSVREVMMEQGRSDEEIEMMLSKLREQRQKGDHPGRGMGRFMPQEVREMGQSFHDAAGNFAQVAKSVSNPPSADDYQRVFAALSEIIDVCSACHSSFRVE